MPSISFLLTLSLIALTEISGTRVKRTDIPPKRIVINTATQDSPLWTPPLPIVNRASYASSLLSFFSSPFKSTTYGASYTGPFTLLSKDILSNTADPTNDFGNEDKLIECNSNLVYVNLDDAGTAADEVMTYTTSTSKWTTQKVIANDCPDAGEGGLLPRDGGYSVGSVAGPYGKDRLLILGGTQFENNVYYSDDCGVTWDCHDGDQFWNARSYSPVLHPRNVFPGDPIIIAGGLANEVTFSVMMGISYNFGIDWQRPYCRTVDNCQNSLTSPDSYGSCASDVWFPHCYLLPTFPALSGSMAFDTTTLYLFQEKEHVPVVGGQGNVFYLNASNVDAGWTILAGAPDGGYGRKVFIRGGAINTGCWYSSDVLAEDLFYYYIPGAEGTSNFSTSPTAAGPWTTYQNLAPWSPRAGAALAASVSLSAAWYGGGMTYHDGQLQTPTFGDVWQIDVGICLLGKGGAVCSGHGEGDLVNVLCSCDTGFSGARCENGSTPNTKSGLSPGAAAAVALTVIGVFAGSGVYYLGGPKVVMTMATPTYNALSKLIGGVSTSAAKTGVPTNAVYKSVATSEFAAAGSGYGSI
jgi:hypothetical protein